MPQRNPSRTPIAVALAACAFALPSLLGADAGNTVEVQLTPAGDFTPSDGRELPVDHWRMDAQVAARVIAQFHARKNPAVLDYEHQTLNAQDNGRPAPAAGWIRDLVWREGRGLFACVELTERARQHIAAGEYRYISPVFRYDTRSGDVTAIDMAALTNHPALTGMQPLELRAAATFLHPSHQEPSMNKLMLAVCLALGLAAEATTEDQAIAALTARMQVDPLSDVRQALGLATDAKPDTITAACSALKTKAEASSADPSKYVPVAQFESLKTDFAALSAKLTTSEVSDLVNAGLSDGRLLAAQKDWATALGGKDIAALKAYLDTAQPIAALRASQTGGNPPANAKTEANPEALTTDELAVCRACGISAEAFAKAKAA